MMEYYNGSRSRKHTVKLMDLLAEGLLDADTVLEACLCYMSDSDVEDMMRSNDMLPKEEYEDEVEDDLDPMEDYNYVGHPMHY
jgi:hypothetical protein